MQDQFACAQWPWGTSTREQFVQSCKDLSEVGFRHFESVKTFIDTFRDQAEDFRSITREYDLHPISFYFFLSGDYDQNIADIREKIGFVESCGIKTVCVQSVWSDKPATPEQLDFAVRTITDFARICADHGVLACVHPHHNTTVMYRSDIEHLMQNTDPALVGLAPDTAHLVAAQCDPVDIFARYMDRIRFVHLKDITGDTVGGVMQDGVEVYDNFREMGEGQVDFPAIFRLLKEANYQGYLCAELDRPRISNAHSAAMNLAYLKAHW